MLTQLLLAAWVVLPAADPQDAKKDRALDALQGEWVCVETANEKGTERGDDRIQMVIKGNKAILSFAGLKTNDGTVEVGSGVDGETMTLKLDNDKPFLGVYKLDGDNLTICFDEAGKDRPAGLTPKGTQWVEKWKRAEP